MAEADPVTVTSDGEDTTLRLSNITVHDPDVVDYFEENPDEETVRRVLRIGVQAIRAAETTDNVDFVERRFQNLQTTFEQELEEFEQELEDTFKDETGRVPQILDGHIDNLEEALQSHLGEEGEFIREALDHDESPINDVSDKIVDLRDEIMREEGREEEYLLGTQKGDDFEDRLEAMMQQRFIGPMDDLEPTGTKTGGKGDSKKGDFLITTDTGQRIAIEAKRRTQSMSKSDIGEYLENTLQNREADYAIMVMRNADAVPTTKMGWFHEFDRERLCVVLSEGPDADVEWRFLAFAYNWARARVAQSQADTEDIDGDAINQELEVIEEQISSFESIQNTARTIREDAKDIIDDLDKAERTIMQRLGEVKSELGVEA